MESILEVLDIYKEKYPHHITGHPYKRWFFNGEPLLNTSHWSGFIEDEGGQRIHYFMVTSDCGLKGIAVISQREL